MDGIHFGLGIMLGWYVLNYGDKKGWSRYKSFTYSVVMMVGYCEIGHGLAYVATYLLL
jgi:hypothetical protein